MRGRKEAIVISNDTRNKRDEGRDKTTSKKNGISFAEVMKPENAGKMPTLN